MSWTQIANNRLTRATGYRLTRNNGRVPRLVRQARRQLTAPVFLFSSVRSGSTLLRMILNSHSQLYAPHELHLGALSVEFQDTYVRESMAALGYDQDHLTTMLWDQVLTTALRDSGKSTLVEKTPKNVFMWRRIARTWPDARYVILLRHPASIIDSWQRARPNQSIDEAVAEVLRYARKVEEARTSLPGFTIRYEDLVADPAGHVKQLCDFLGVEWEPQMLEYGQRDHGAFKAGLGDWTDRIRSGEVQEPRPVPEWRDEFGDELRTLAESWSYPTR